MKGLPFRVALLLASVAFTLILFEIALRIAGPSTRASDRRGLHELRPDRAWLYGLRPGAQGTLEADSEVTYRINADGFRDRNYLRPKPDGVFRVLVLGDSVAYGYGVEGEESFPKVLERELAAAIGGGERHRVEVLNLGVSGYNPYTEAALLADRGSGYEPDLVLVQFCINDLNDPTLHFDAHARQHLGVIPDAAFPDPTTRRAPAAPPGALLRWCRRSRLCARFDELALRIGGIDPDDSDRSAAVLAVDGSDGPEWPWIEGLYRKMFNTSRALGAGFAVIAFPYPAQLSTGGEHPVQSRLVALGAANHWATVDPLESFRAASRGGEELFLDWWHPTPAGHRLAAREISDALACAELLPPLVARLCTRH